MYTAAMLKLLKPQHRNSSVHIFNSVRNLVTSTMAVSNFKKSLKTPFFGAFQMISDPIVTEQYGNLFGAVLIDQQHGLLDERTAFECVQR